MADKAISELVETRSVTPDSLFVLQQDGTAKKLTAQVLENWLVSFADGHGGIQSIVKKSTSGLVDTYRITLADTTTFDFMVTNGKGINSVSKVSTSGLVDTYRIAFNDGTSSTFTVTNGEKGDKGDRADIWVKYASQKPTASSHSFGDVPDSWIGIATGHNMDTAPTGWQQYTWFQWKGEKGDTGDPATLVSSQVTYQVGDSGTIIPSGSWTTSVPPVTPSKFLWTRQVLQFNTGAPITSYSISRFGIDGTGSVSTVAGISPDAAGNVPLTATDVKALPLAGGTMQGSINMNGQKITGLNAPTQSNEVATKGYVDNAKPNLTGYATETYVNNSVGGKVDKSSVVNNFTTTEEGFVADARALKTLYDTKLSKELLWENASYTSAFASNSIMLPLGKYDHVEIVFMYSTGVMWEMTGSAEIGMDGVVSAAMAKSYYRPFVTNTESVFFDNAVSTNTYGGSTSQTNDRLIPIKIYGIKGATV